MITCDYAIVLDGELGDDLHAAFAPAQVSTADGTTIVRASDVDQAALHAILEAARDLGLVLVEVQRDEAGPLSVAR